MQARVGLGGYVRTGCPAPVVVDLDNPGPSIEGDLVIRGPNSEVTRVAVNLPRYSRKRYVAYAVPPLGAPASSSWSLDVGLERDGKRLLAQAIGTKLIAESTLLVVTCTGGGTGLPVIDGGSIRISDGGDERRLLRSVQVAPADFPTAGTHLAAADLVVVNGAGWQELSPQQRSSLRTWLEQGGWGAVARPCRAILCGDRPGDWRDETGRSLVGRIADRVHVIPRRLLLRAGRTRETVRLPQGGSVSSLTGTPDGQAGSALITVGEAAVARLRWVGAGAALWIGFDPFRVSLRGWPDAARFWDLAIAHAVRAERPGYLRPNDLMWAVMPDPSFSLRFGEARRALLVGGFALFMLFGPGIALFIRRWRRTTWIWLSVPMLSVGVTLALLSGEAAWAERTALLQSATVLEAWPGALSMRQYTSVSLRRLIRLPLTVRIEDEAPLLGTLEPPTYDTASDRLYPRWLWPEWPSELSPGESVFAALADGDGRNTWLIERVRAIPGAMELRRTGTDRLEILNVTGLDLTACWTVHNGRAVPLGRLPNGSRFNLPTARSMPPVGQLPPADLALLTSLLSDKSRPADGGYPPKSGRWFVARVSGFHSGVEFAPVKPAKTDCFLRLWLPPSLP